MADVSAEPSMEEILSSIKRIIAEEEGAPARRRGVARAAAPAPEDDDAGNDDGILELRQPLAPEGPVSRPFAPPPVSVQPPPQVEEPAPAAALPPPDPAPSTAAPSAAASPAAASPAAAPTVAPQPVAAPPPELAAPPAEPIVSSHAVDATRGSLESLSRLIVRPSGGASTGGEETLEGLVRELLKPMLRDWLDAKLPGIVETMVAREIARISGRDA